MITKAPAESPTNWTKEKLAVLLLAASQAIDRSRYVFIVLNIAGVCIIAALFNAILPWIRHVIPRIAKLNPAPPELNMLRKTLTEDLTVITAPLLGIKFSVFDLSLIGTTALLVIAIWQYYCVRRENQTVHTVCEEAARELKNGNSECAKYLYHGIAHHFVFTTKFGAHAPAGMRAEPAPTFVVVALFFMPAWIPFVILATDILSLALTCKVCPNPAQPEPLFFVLGPLAQVEAVLRMAYAATIGGVSLYYCYKGLEYENGTRRDLDQLKQGLESNGRVVV